MDNEAIEKLLEESGVKGEMEKMLNEAGQTTTEQTFEAPASVQTEVDSTASTTDQVQEQAQQKVGIWDDILPQSTEQTAEKDWKKEYEAIQAQNSEILSKIEANKILKRLYEVADAPDFDAPKFFAAHAPKTNDVTKLSLEQLYKEKLSRDQFADYSPVEIEKLWDKKKAELEMEDDGDRELSVKSLRSQMIRELQSEQAQNEDEPELIKEWRESTKSRQEQAQLYHQEQKELQDGLATFAKGIVGKKIGGIVPVEQADADAFLSVSSDMFMDANGKMDHAKVSLFRLKSIMFDKMMDYMNKDAVIEARNQITRPAAKSGGGQMVDTDDRDEDTKLLEGYAVAKGLPKDYFTKK